MAVNERGGAFSGGPSTDADIVRDGPIDESTAGGTADATPGGAFGSGISQGAETGIERNALEVADDLAAVRALLAEAILARDAARLAESEAEAAELASENSAVASAAQAAAANLSAMAAAVSATTAADEAADASLDSDEAEAWSQVSRSWVDGTAPVADLTIIGSPSIGDATDNAEFWSGQAEGFVADAAAQVALAESARAAAVVAQVAAEAAETAAETARTAAQASAADALTAQGRAEDAEDAAVRAQGDAETAATNAGISAAAALAIETNLEGITVVSTGGVNPGDTTQVTLRNADLSIFGQAFTVQPGTPGVDGADGALGSFVDISGQDPIFNPVITDTVAAATALRLLAGAAPISTIGITQAQADAIILNTAKRTFPVARDGAITTNANAITGLDTRLTTAEMTIIDHGTEIETNERDIGDINTTLTANGMTLADHETRITDVEAFDTAQSLLNTGLRDDVDTNEAGLVSVNNNLGLLSGRVTIAETDITSLEMNKQDDIPAVNITRAGDDTATFDTGGNLNISLADVGAGEVLTANDIDPITSDIEILDTITIGGTDRYRLRGAPVFVPPVALSRFDINIFYDEDLFPGARTTIEKPVFDRDDGTLHQFRIEPRIVGLNGTQITTPTFNFVNTSYGMFARIGTSQQFGMNLTTAQVNQFNTYDFDSQGSWTETNGDDVNVVVNRNQAVQYFSVRDYYTFTGTTLPTLLSQFTSRGRYSSGVDFNAVGGTRLYVLLPQMTFGTDDPALTYRFTSGVPGAPGITLNNTELLMGNTIAAGFSLYQLNDYNGSGNLDITISTR